METLLEKLKWAFAHQAIVEGLPIKAEHTNRLAEIAYRLSNEHNANTVLAASGLTVNDIVETLTLALREINQYEYGQGERYENETYIKVHSVREALKAACDHAKGG